MRTFADWTLRPRLLGVPGVAKAVIFGGEVRQLQIQVLPDRLAAFDLSITDVLAAARASTGVRGAGFVESATQRIVLQTQGQALTAAELGEVTLARHDGVTVRIKDVARVADGAEPKVGDAAIDGQPGVMIEVSSQYGANTLDVTAALEKALAEMRPAIAAQGIVLHDRIFRPADFIETSIRNINHSLMLGAILVAVVLFVFLFNIRTAFISLTAIPLSLLLAIAGSGVARHHAEHADPGRPGDRHRRSGGRRHHRRREHPPPPAGRIAVSEIPSRRSAWFWTLPSKCAARWSMPPSWWPWCFCRC